MLTAQHISTAEPARRRGAQPAPWRVFRQAPVRPLDTSGAPLLQRKPNCACGGGCPRCQSSAPAPHGRRLADSGDALETEADRVAEAVVRASNPPAALASQEADRPADLSPRRDAATRPASGDSPLVEETLRSEGQPLDAATRALMESRFAYDFGQVRVHDDVAAVRSAAALGARAYTVGRDVAFNRGRYAPDTAEGRELLAHELTHVVQQTAQAGEAEGAAIASRLPPVHAAGAVGVQMQPLAADEISEDEKEAARLLEVITSSAFQFYTEEAREELQQKFASLPSSALASKPKPPARAHRVAPVKVTRPRDPAPVRSVEEMKALFDIPKAEGETEAVEEEQIYTPPAASDAADRDAAAADKTIAEIYSPEFQQYSEDEQADVLKRYKHLEARQQRRFRPPPEAHATPRDFLPEGERLVLWNGVPTRLGKLEAAFPYAPSSEMGFLEGMEYAWETGETEDRVEMAATGVGLTSQVVPYFGDYVSAGASFVSFTAKPSWESLGEFGLDAFGAVAPFVPAMGTVNKGRRVLSTAQAARDAKKVERLRKELDVALAGLHRDTRKAGKTFGTESHHLLADSASDIATPDGLALRMLKEHHKLTGSYASSKAARAFQELQRTLRKQGRYDEALEVGVDDVLDKFGELYAPEIQEMYDSVVDNNGKIDWAQFLRKAKKKK